MLYEIFEVGGTEVRNTVHIIYDKELDLYKVIQLKDWFDTLRRCHDKLNSLIDCPFTTA